MKFRTESIFIYLVSMLLPLHYGCHKNTSAPNPNLPPSTTIANVPLDGDTLFALVKLQWDGGDPDGYVVGYQYKYTTYYSDETGFINPSSGDSVEQDWSFTEETSLTIAFNSHAKLNMQRFWVRSVDNCGEVDPTPAEKVFYTVQTIAPEAKILTPKNNVERYVLDQTTDWWPGILLTYEGFDEDGEVVDYGWSIDGSDWVWTPDTSMYITPDLLSPPLEGTHTIRIVARDNTNIVSESPASVTIPLVKPTFDKDILIIDETNEREFPSSLRVTDEEVDSWYADIFNVPDPADWWDYEYHELRDNPVPDLKTLGRYKTVLWHADNRPSREPHKFVLHEDYLKDYMNVGGNLILSGWRVLKSFAWDKDFPVTFADDSFVKEYLHIKAADETPYYPGDFSGATAPFGSSFGDMKVDSLKLVAFPFYGMLSNINIITMRSGFTEVLFQYYNRPGSPLFQYMGKPCALLYTGTTFNAIVFGFPLYFMMEEDVRSMSGELMKLIGY